MTSIEVWNSERIFHSGREYFEALESDISLAKKMIELETYIFEDDELGRHMVDLLCEASERGVAVRVMVDGVGSTTFLSGFGERLDKAGVQFRIFNPTPLDLNLLTYRFFPGLRRSLRFLGRTNRRNHRKVVIIDQNAVWSGGINVSAKQSSKFSGVKAWRDTGIRVQGRGITEFIKAFEMAWAQAWSPIPQKKRIEFFWRRFRLRRSLHAHRLVQFNYTRSLRRRMNAELVESLNKARERIWITTAYFIPEISVMRAIRRAAHRGTDVRIILPGTSDIFFTPWVGTVFYITLLKAGVQIFEYEPRMMHAKTLLIDTWGAVCSANLNHRSVFHDLEVNVVVTTEEGILSLERQFLVDQSLSHLVTVADWKNRSWLVRFVGSLLLFLKYWF